MPISRNFYVLWFAGAFLGGSIISAIVFMGWMLFVHSFTVNKLHVQGSPVVVITNPFIDITNPISGKAIASVSGSVAYLTAAFLSGLGTGALGLRIAG